MKRSPGIMLAGAASLGIGWAVLAPVIEMDPPQSPRVPALAAANFDISDLRSGDLVFRRGTSFASRVVLATDSLSSYSHVGMVTIDGSDPLVIHASPGADLLVAEPLRIDPLEEYLSEGDSIGAVVLRFPDPSISERAAEAAQSFVRRSVVFDGSFDLSTTGEMYCTELVWSAYLAAGIDLVDGEFSRIEGLDFLLGQRPLLLPSRLLQSRHLEEVRAAIQPARLTDLDLPRTL